MWGKAAVKLPLSQNAPLAGSAGVAHLEGVQSTCHFSVNFYSPFPSNLKSPYHNLSTLLSQVADGGRGEVEVAGL